MQERYHSYSRYRLKGNVLGRQQDLALTSDFNNCQRWYAVQPDDVCHSPHSDITTSLCQLDSANACYIQLHFPDVWLLAVSLPTNAIPSVNFVPKYI